MDLDELSSDEEGEGPKTEIPGKRPREAMTCSPMKRHKSDTIEPCIVLAKRQCEVKGAPTSSLAVKSLADQTDQVCDVSDLALEPKIAARVDIVETSCVCGIRLRTPKEPHWPMHK